VTLLTQRFPTLNLAVINTDMTARHQLHSRNLMKKQTLWHLALRLALVLSVALMITGAVSANAQDEPPPVPHSFYGAAEINGRPAAVGARIEARGPGVLSDVEGNPVLVSVVGRYGERGFGVPKLVVQGAVAEDTPLTFYINGSEAEVAVPGGEWQKSFPFASGAITELNLRAAGYTLYVPITQR
jgi:hypothetical protein